MKLNSEKPCIMNYIRLPRLNHIKVSNYSLFDNDFSYKVKEGLNIFIGANGLGKTTTTSLLIYGLVGYTNDKYSSKDKVENFKLDADYFLSRSKSSGINREDDPVLIDISFSFEENIDFRVIRNLASNEIIRFSVNNDELDPNTYDSELEKSSNLKPNDLAFLLEFFLIREEEGNYLLWDFRKQSKLLQLLLNPVGFKGKYSKLEEEATKLNSEINRILDKEIGPLKNRIESLKEAKLNQSKNSNSKLSSNEINTKLDRIKNDIALRNMEKEELFKNLDYILKQISEADTKVEIFNSEIDASSDKIFTFENMLHKHAYSDEKVNTALHKLKHYKICMFCNKENLSDKKRIDIISKIEVRNSCPVCSSRIQDTTDSIDNPEILIDEIEKESKLLEELKLDRSATEKSRHELSNEYEIHNTSLKRINTDLSSLALIKLKLEIEAQKIEKPEDVTILDIQINELQNEVDSHDKKLDPKRQKLKNKRKKLVVANEKLTNKTNKALEKLNLIFSNLAEKFFKDECKLIIHDRQIKTSLQGIRQSYYIPFFEGKKRTLEKHCSTSERLFLEYLFRMSILNLYSEESGCPSFLIMETSEGAFDIGITPKLAQSFVEFSRSQSSTIIIANFSKKDYLTELVKGINYEKTRVLNYLDFSSLSKSQEVYRKNYEEAFEEIFKE